MSSFKTRFELPARSDQRSLSASVMANPTFNAVILAQTINSTGTHTFENIFVSQTGIFTSIISNNINLISITGATGTTYLNHNNSIFPNINVGVLSADIINVNKINIQDQPEPSEDHSHDNINASEITTNLLTTGNTTINGDITVNGSIIMNTANAYKQGGQLWNILSDKRYKKDISPISETEENELENAIEHMDIKRFKYIDSDEENIGVIAQELQELYPKSIKEFNNKMHVNFNDLFFGMIISIKAMKKRIEYLENINK